MNGAASEPGLNLGLYFCVDFPSPSELIGVTYFVVAVNNKQIDSLCDSFIVNTTRDDARALCKLASVKTRQIHHNRV